MADYTYEQLKHMKVDELREIAAGLEHEAVKGHTQLNKDHLIPALCEALGIEAHEHHEVVGIDKTKIKAEIKELKVARTAALEGKDSAGLKIVRKKIHRLKRELRSHMV